MSTIWVWYCASLTPPRYSNAWFQDVSSFWEVSCFIVRRKEVLSAIYSLNRSWTVQNCLLLGALLRSVWHILTGHKPAYLMYSQDTSQRISCTHRTQASVSHVLTGHKPAYLMYSQDTSQRISCTHRTQASVSHVLTGHKPAYLMYSQDTSQRISCTHRTQASVSHDI